MSRVHAALGSVARQTASGTSARRARPGVPAADARPRRCSRSAAASPRSRSTSARQTAGSPRRVDEHDGGGSSDPPAARRPSAPIAPRRARGGALVASRAGPRRRRSRPRWRRARPGRSAGRRAAHRTTPDRERGGVLTQLRRKRRLVELRGDHDEDRPATGRRQRPDRPPQERFAVDRPPACRRRTGSTGRRPGRSRRAGRGHRGARGPRTWPSGVPAEDPAPSEVLEQGHDVLPARGGGVAQRRRGERPRVGQAQRDRLELEVGRARPGQVVVDPDDPAGRLECADARVGTAGPANRLSERWRRGDRQACFQSIHRRADLDRQLRRAVLRIASGGRPSRTNRPASTRASISRSRPRRPSVRLPWPGAATSGPACGGSRPAAPRARRVRRRDAVRRGRAPRHRGRRRSHRRGASWRRPAHPAAPGAHRPDPGARAIRTRAPSSASGSCPSQASASSASASADVRRAEPRSAARHR